MASPKENPKRWYIVMVFCVVFSFFVFVVGPRLGYNPDVSHDIALMIGLWAPTLGILGVRAELLRRKE
jgi:lipopolysaccharide export LptBFGC system permease protein LptF